MSNVLYDSHFSYGPAAVVAGHVLVAVYLLVTVVWSLRRTYRGLGSSVKSNSLLPLFAALALISLGRAVYGAVDYGVLSYKVWASSHDIELPVRFYGDGGIFGDKATPIYPLHWLNDTPFYLDAVQILTERPRRFWWGQQLDLALISWNMFLAIEGRRRNMPLLWSYQLLANLVSLAFAQNLFFVAMLLTPVPLPHRGDTSIFSRAARRLFWKPTNWVPNTWVFGVPLILSYMNVFWIPTRFGETDLKYWVLALRVLTALPLLARDVVPISWGTRYSDLGNLYPTYTKMLRYMSLTAFFIHFRTSLAGLFFVDPEPHNHRHDEFLKYDVEQRDAWERTTSAFGRLLESTSDHPVVGLAGADVILASISIGFWVAARAMDMSDILACTTPGFSAYREEDQPRIPTEQITMTWWEADALMMSGANGNGLDSPARQRGRRLKSSRAKRNSPAPREVEATDEAPPSEARDWESAAVVWGLTALGGLGLGSAGAYGSEIVAV